MKDYILGAAEEAEEAKEGAEASDTEYQDNFINQIIRCGQFWHIE